MAMVMDTVAEVVTATAKSKNLISVKSPVAYAPGFFICRISSAALAVPPGHAAGER